MGRGDAHTRRARGEARASAVLASLPSKRDFVPTLERQDCAGLGGAGDCKPQPLDDPAHLGNLFGIGLRQLARADPERILKAHPHIAAHGGRLGCDRHLGAAGAEHAPAISVAAEQAVGGAAHVHHILRVGADAAKDAEHRLHEQRRRDQPAVEKMREIVQVPDVVAFELEAGAVILAGFQHEFDVAKRVAEDEVAGAFQIRLLPIVLEAFVAAEHREQREVDRAHIEARDLGLEHFGRAHPFLDPHGRGTAGGQVDHRVAALLDDRQKGRERLGPLVRPAGLRIAGMQVDDGGARFRRADRGVGDFLRGDRQVRRHRRGVDRAGHGAGDDDLAGCRHGASFGFSLRAEARASCPRFVQIIFDRSGVPGGRDARAPSATSFCPCGIRSKRFEFILENGRTATGSKF